MDIVWVRARALLRHGWAGTLTLAVLVGLCAGAAMATATAGRRTLTVFDRLLEYSNPPSHFVVFCPPEMTSVDQESLPTCFNYDHREERAVIADLPEVDAAVPARFSVVMVADADRPDDPRPASTVFVEGEGIESVDGRPIIVDGRWYDDDEHEIVVNERFRDLFDAAVGRKLVLTFPDRDDFGAPPSEGEQLHGRSVDVTVAGVVRGVQDLSAATDAPGVLEGDAHLVASDAIIRAAGPMPVTGGTLVRGAAPWHEVVAAIERSFPDRIFNASLTSGPDESEPIRSAIRHEGHGILALGLLGGAAVAVVTAQSVARVRRRERTDESVLGALGATGRQLAVAAALRGLAVWIVTGAVAVSAAIVLSPIGSIGVGRLAEPNHGMVTDWVVLGSGLLVLAVLLVASALWPARSRERSAMRPPATSRRLSGVLPLGIGLGTHMLRGRRWDGSGLSVGTALTTVAGAAAAATAALGLIASLDGLTAAPARFGAPWDVSLSSSDTAVDPAEVLPLVQGRVDVTQAAVLVGFDALIDGEPAWVHAFAPLPGVDEQIEPPLLDGRAPSANDEIALGAVTMDRLGVEIGDSVAVRNSVAGSEATRMTVVGIALVNDLYEPSPGRGAIVSGSWVRGAAPESTPGPYVLRLDERADVPAVAAELRSSFSGLVLPPVPPSAIRNLTRIRGFPLALAAAVAVLAAGAFAHAIVLTLRRNRQPVAVLKALGFTRRQVTEVVTGHAARLGIVAVSVGVPTGIVLGRLGWRALARGIGVAEAPVTPVVSVAGVGLAVIALAIVMALVPAWRERRLPVGEALRAE